MEKGNAVKNLIKKNQLMITALAIMIAIAGYLQFAGTNLEKEYLASDNTEDLRLRRTKGRFPGKQC